MIKKRKIRNLLLGGLLLGMILLGSVVSYGRGKGAKIYIPEGVYINLTKEFYDALKEEADKGTRVYRSDPSAEYLKQISISSRFMVETNLEILRQQESIIKLLHSILNKKK